MRFSVTLNLLFFTALVIAIFCSFGAADAAVTLSRDDRLQIRRCVSHMLIGPQVNGVKLKGEGFNCKPVKAKLVGKNLVVTGQLSHQLSYRPDDQVNYTMEFALDGTLIKGEASVEDGGVFKALRFLKLGLDLALDQIAAEIDNDWKGYSQLILGGLQAQISRGLAESTNRFSTTYFMDRPYGDIRRVKLKSNNNFAGVDVSDRAPDSYVQACRFLCNAEAKCLAWTFIRSDRACYLKDASFGALSFHAEGVTGLRQLR